MWWIISLIGLVLLVIEAVMTTFLLLIVLNGFTSLPDALVNIYLVCTCGLLLLLSLLGGYLAKKLAQISPLPLWLAGVLTTMVNLVIIPVLLFVLTFGLLAAFGMI